MNQRLLQAMTELATGLSAALSAPPPTDDPAPIKAAPVAPAIGTPFPAETGAGSPDEMGHSPFEAPETTVLRTPMDTTNCGEYAFSLYQAQLIVSMLGTDGGVGGEYDVSRLPLHVWVGLRGRDGTSLPVLVLRDHGVVSVQVGNVGPPQGREATPSR